MFILFFLSTTLCNFNTIPVPSYTVLSISEIREFLYVPTFIAIIVLGFLNFKGLNFLTQLVFGAWGMFLLTMHIMGKISTDANILCMLAALISFFMCAFQRYQRIIMVINGTYVAALLVLFTVYSASLTKFILFAVLALILNFLAINVDPEKHFRAVKTMLVGLTAVCLINMILFSCIKRFINNEKAFVAWVVIMGTWYGTMGILLASDWLLKKIKENKSGKGDEV